MAEIRNEHDEEVAVEIRDHGEVDDKDHEVVDVHNHHHDEDDGVEPPEVEEEDDSARAGGGVDDDEDLAAAGSDEAKATTAKSNITNKDWPLKGIKEPHANDVLYGRGGGTNHHPGNKRYRKLVEDRKIDYVNSKRLDKPLVALEIIKSWRTQDPPGRFLKLDEKTGLWHDVGDKKAREKTSQALREKAPLIRKQQEEEKMTRNDLDEDSDEEEENVKTTRFAEGTNLEDGNDDVKKAVLARDHSLGREYLEPNEAMTLEGFSWQDPFQSGSQERLASQGSLSMPPPGYAPAGPRIESQGSMNGYYPYPSHGQPPPPPVPGPYMSAEERHHRYTSSGRYESWGSMASGPPPPPMPPGYGPPQYSGSWGPGREPSIPLREHSLGQNPLPHASVGHPAHYSTFDYRPPSYPWGPPPPPPPPPPPAYRYPHEFQYHTSGGPPMPPPPPPGREYSSGAPIRSSGPVPPPSPPYQVDPSVASTWSGQDPMAIAKTWSESSEERDRFPRMTPTTSPRGAKVVSDEAVVPKPDIVKRATSNQNETFETKPDLRGPSVKRAALNRDNSMASNRLKETYLPDYYGGRTKREFNAEQEMRMLSDNFEQSTLDSTSSQPPRPRPPGIMEGDRTTTFDRIAMDLMVKPVSITEGGRSSTIEALALALDDDQHQQPLMRPGQVQRTSTMEEIFNELRTGLARPSALTMDDRLTTTDYLAIVNEPIAEDEVELTSDNSKDKQFDTRDAAVAKWIKGV